MTPTALALIFSLVEEAVKIEPALAADLAAIFSKPNPTPADWEALRTKLLGESYAAFVPASDLPQSPAPVVVPEPLPQAAD